MKKWFTSKIVMVLLALVVGLGAGLGVIATSSSPVGAVPISASYVITTPNNSLAPQANLTFYGGSGTFTSVSSYADSRRIYFPQAGTLETVYIAALQTGTKGSSEQASVYIRINNTTDYLITNTAAMDAPINGYNVWSTDTLTLPIVAGDYFEIKIVMPPTFVTRPGIESLIATVFVAS